LVLNFKQIKGLLPHRFPFLLVDRIIDFDPGKSITGIKNITGNEIFLQGHFSEEAIMPGTMILEAMAQIALIFFKLSNVDSKKDLSPVLFGGIKGKFLKPVIPGDVLNIKITPLKILNSGGVMNGKATVEGNLVCKAELIFSAKSKEA
jgi:3-hydroxyacyl-[acyl-carrier-protein] dehydratase